jgi:hypothetical protein
LDLIERERQYIILVGKMFIFYRVFEIMVGEKSKKLECGINL